MRRETLGPIIAIAFAWVLWSQSDSDGNFYNRDIISFIMSPWEIQGAFERKARCDEALVEEMKVLLGKEGHSKVGQNIVKVQKVVERQTRKRRSGWLGTKEETVKKKETEVSFIRLLCLPATLDPRSPQVTVEGR